MARHRGFRVGAGPVGSWGPAATARPEHWLRIAAIRLPRISNSTDIEALACEPGVLVRWVTDPADLADADVVVIPGSKATVPDLAWLRGVAWPRRSPHTPGTASRARHLRRLPDAVPAASTTRRIRGGRVAGLGLLDADIAFAPEKTLRRWTRRCHGYEIHHGQLTRCAEQVLAGGDVRSASCAQRDSARTGTDCSTTMSFRRRWLVDAAMAAAGTASCVAPRRRRAGPP